MSAEQSRDCAELTEHDVDVLIYASQENRAVEAPGMRDADTAEATRLTNALAKLREAERDLSEAARVRLGVSAQDLRAIQFLVTSQRQGEVVTPSMLARFLHISAASTTKLLNRLERDAHITRLIHPTDRRAFTIQVSLETEALTRRSVGRQQARRLLAALQLPSHERAVITKFLEDLTAGIADDTQHWRASPDSKA